MALFLPETSRCIVGNGSRNVSALYRPIFRYHQSRKSIPQQALNEEETIPRNFRIPNPLATLKVLASRDSLLITAIYGVYYMNFSCLQGSLSTLFIDIYRLSELKAGLVYLPFGVGSCIGAYCSGTTCLFVGWKRMAFKFNYFSTRKNYEPRLPPHSSCA